MMSADHCHPERSLAQSEATRQTQSKDRVPADGITGDARNFHIVVRFFEEDEDGREASPHYESSREAAVSESPARQCWVAPPKKNECRRDATLTADTSQQ